ncbi:MAG TPA: NAD(P)H-binding protein [Gemmatimonadales bacterium]|nr:NAD(P)H-binding protein [Gemmatimonadales bacterium]
MTITVAGSTGTIGSALVQRLSAEGAPVRAVTRSLQKVRPLPHVAWVQANLGDEQLLEPVLAGTDQLFLLSGIEPGFGTLQSNVIRAAERLGVKHVVKLSALGASDHSKSGIAREHWDAEEVLRDTTLRWTILRPHSFMQNMLYDIAASVRSEGVIHAAIGDGRVPFIDARDVAAVAAETLLHPEAHEGRVYTLTGGVALGYADIAQAMTDVLGTPVSYNQLSMDEARSRLEAVGLPSEAIDGILALAAYQNAGGATERVYDTVENILGRVPSGIREFVMDYRESFERSPA